MVVRENPSHDDAPTPADPVISESMIADTVHIIIRDTLDQILST